MNLRELKESIRFHFSGHGHWKVTYTTKSGRTKNGVTTNSIAIDRINNSDLNEKELSTYGCTLKQALLALKDSTK